MTTDANHNPMVIAAAQWLAEQMEPPARVVPVLRERFSLSMKEACDACALAQSYRAVRRAFG
jgi:hypothetical protein